MRRQKHPIVEFLGVRFYKKPSGYMVCDAKNSVHGQRYLHRAVWVETNGPIPVGFHIHHADENKRNNDIGNLRILSAAEHMSHHTTERYARDPESVLRGICAARAAAPAWHRSDAGRQWHKEHAKRVAVNSETEARICTWCKKEYEGTKHRAKRSFCSMSCQGAARVASGVDDENRNCTLCGAEYRCNKYNKKTTCSRSCSATVAQRKRYGLRPDGS